MLTVADVQILELRDAVATGGEGKVKYQKMFTILQRATNCRRAQDPLPSPRRIHLVIDIRNHQKPSDFGQHQQLTREGFDRLVAGIQKAYGQQSEFGKRITNSHQNATGKGSSKAAVLDAWISMVCTHCCLALRH